MNIHFNYNKNIKKNTRNKVGYKGKNMGDNTGS